MEAYSNCGRMRVWYAVDFSSCFCTLIFLLRKSSDWFAFLVMLAMYVPSGKLKSSDMVTLGN